VVATRATVAVATAAKNASSAAAKAATRIETVRAVLEVSSETDPSDRTLPAAEANPKAETLWFP